MSEKKRPVGNHDADIENPNRGTPGTNITWDKAQGNRGKLKNPNQKGVGGYLGAKVMLDAGHPIALTGPKTLSFDRISIIIPVKDNQKGVDAFLMEFARHCRTETCPKEIILVDNNSRAPLVVRDQIENFVCKLQVEKCSKPGPAAARNHGAKVAQGDWLLFLDSDCIPTASTIFGYFASIDGSLAYAGQVKSLKNDLLSSYYDSQAIFWPPIGPEASPQYLVTANAMVWKSAFDLIGGFNETYPLAGGEDVDLGIRLSRIGKISYAPGSQVLHDVETSLWAFLKRFYRYGAGSKLVSQLLGVEMKPRPFRPLKPTLAHWCLARLQYIGLQAGYKSF